MTGRRCDLKGTCSPDSFLSSWSEEIDTCFETRLALRNKGAYMLTYSLSSLDLLTYLVLFGMLTLTWNISQIGFISLYPLGKEPIENICKREAHSKKTLMIGQTFSFNHHIQSRPFTFLLPLVEAVGDSSRLLIGAKG